MADKITKTDAEWRAELTPEQYRVLREHGTERACTSPLNNEKASGHVSSARVAGRICSPSDTKFDSGCGWPSYYAPDLTGSGEPSMWTSRGFQQRTEVRCAKCDGHLGHVFPTGQIPRACAIA